MTFRIRPAEPNDAEAIRRIHLSAFPTALEADLVERLDRDGDLIISLVAERQNEAVGHVALSRMKVEAEGRRWRALALGPIGVERSMQGSGAGSALIEAAKAVAKATKEELIFVLGEPDYYHRFGFSAEIAAPFESPFSGPFFMTLALQPGLSVRASGSAEHATAFAELDERT